LCPTLIVAGGNDRLLPPDQARELHCLLPDSRLIVIEEGAHFIPYQRPREFAEMVEGFLRESAGRLPVEEG
jgi:pimeloyl-ACP methyl ester carboxylesterase